MLVEIWSDVVCPWCAIGRSRFLQALSSFEHRDEVEVRWRSFELDPRRPRTLDGSYVDALASKYRTSHQQAQAMIDRMTAAGAEDGIDFRFDLAKPGNTFDAHRVLHLAAEQGMQDAVKARFLEGYHTAGAPIGEHDTLVRLAAEAGLDTDEVRRVLASDAYAAEVRGDEERAMELGISGVPFFLIDGRFGVPGAQPGDHLLGMLLRARQRRDASVRS